MTDSVPWHEDDSFWHTWGPMMFTPQRIADAGKEIEQIAALAAVSAGARVLDLCCGIGRHSLELARRGFKVTAVDRTPEYLDQAAARAKREGLDIEFVHEDMRAFCRPDTFDAAINLFTSFGFFVDPQEDRRVVENVCRSLKPSGVLVMDMNGKETLARIFRERDWHEGEGALFLAERKLCNSWSWIENRWIMYKEGQRREWTVSHRLYAASELTALLRAGGFAEANAYGGLDGSPYDQNARRLVAVARKAQ